jgi:hypothetical protein
MGYDFEKYDEDLPPMPVCKPPKAEPKIIPDAVCPVCFKQLESPTIIQQGTDLYKRELRTYFGYCPNCSGGCIVVQFKREERWIIHKFRPAVVVGLASVLEISNKWQLMSEPPEPAPVMLGPGGDFKEPITPGTKGFFEKLKTMREGLGRLCESIDEWLSENDE